MPLTVEEIVAEIDRREHRLSAATNDAERYGYQPASVEAVRSEAQQLRSLLTWIESRRAAPVRKEAADGE